MAPPRRAARRLGVALSVILLVAGAAAASGQEPRAPEKPTPFEELVLPPLVVTAPPPISASSEQLIPGKDFELRPQGRPTSCAWSRGSSSTSTRAAARPSSTSFAGSWAASPCTFDGPCTVKA